jgi:thiol-disulfide isomerase/thioredoxin
MASVINAPALIGDTWFGTGGRNLAIEDLRGRFVLLDFWTLCCVNCHHVLAELRPIEAKYHDVLTVIGVHSPKFEHEKRPESVAAGIERHDIHHAVLNDPNMSTWASYGVRAWPTLVLIDPLGKIVANYSGEGHAHALDALLEELVAEYEANGSLIRGKDVYVAPEPDGKLFKQPGKVELIPAELRELFNGADLLVSNSGGHSLIAVSSENPNEALLTIGSGVRGAVDGDFVSAQFAEPYGAVFLPAQLAAELGFHLAVADTANHLIRAVNVETGMVSTIAGTGVQWMQNDATSGPALETRISTPWDIALLEGQLLIAMAGEHRIWNLDLVAGELSIFAGTSNEGLVDGALSEAWFAQPSGLQISTAKPGAVWLVDAETSALRLISDGKIASLVGTGLFDFGHVDGTADQALLQHPLGLDELPDGSVLIADTYNHAIRRFDPSKNQVSTVVRNLAEPSDVKVVETANGPRMVVVEAAASRLSAHPIDASVMVAGDAMRTTRPALEVSSGAVELNVVFTPPPGQKFDERYGPSTALVVSSTPKELLLEGAGTYRELIQGLKINPDVTEGVLHVAARGASCDDDGTEFATCHIHQQDWGIPVRISSSGTRVVQLVLSGAVSE